MADILVQRWSKASKDRLYANLPDGTTIAWMNLSTGDIKIEQPVHRHAAQFALTKVARSGKLPVGKEVHSIHIPGETPTDLAEPASPSTFPAVTPQPLWEPLDDEPWTDLADNAAGQLTTIKSQEAWEKLKRRSRFWAYVMKWLKVHDDFRIYALGAKGEQNVGRVLDRLGNKGWKVIHSIPTGGRSDIDHLLIGTDGVVVINTKYHRRAKIKVTKTAIYINGSQTDHIPQIRKQAYYASRKLTAALGFKVYVKPCVVIDQGHLLRAPEVKRSGNPHDVIVATRYSIPRALWEMENGLGAEQVDAIYEAARRSTTWV